MCPLWTETYLLSVCVSYHLIDVAQRLTHNREKVRFGSSVWRVQFTVAGTALSMLAVHILVNEKQGVGWKTWLGYNLQRLSPVTHLITQTSQHATTVTRCPNI